MSHSGRVLFVSHDASRTGAPLFLLTLLRWLKENTDLPFSVLLRNDGPLRSEFEALADVRFFEANPRLATLIGRVGSELRKRILLMDRDEAYKSRLRRQLSQERISLVYSNTATNGRVLEYLSFLGVPVISHVHELEWTITHAIGPGAGQEDFSKVKRHSSGFIAVSQAVAHNLVEAHGIDRENISVIGGGISIPEGSKERTIMKREALSALGLGPGASIVCCSGTFDARKGADLAPRLLQRIIRNLPKKDIHLVWIGGQPDVAYADLIRRDARLLGVDRRIHLTGQTQTPHSYFAACDVFALLSREDPFPLVVLEAAASGAPIICFESAGGAPEFVGEDAGVVVPYLDLDRMAAAAVRLLSNPDEARKLGSRARDRVMAHYTISHVGPRIAEEIRQAAAK
jgi:glycosyltransferase involved in cell wall biosynthesis